MSFMLCLMILAFMMEMMTLAPQYSTFGTQRFSKNSFQGDVPCKLSLITTYDSDCIMSNISKFSNRISISLPFFSTIFYITNWLLILVGAISLIMGPKKISHDKSYYFGDWGLGIGDWGLGIGPPIPNPQSPIPIYLQK
jgi:hypothetical protein